MPSNQRALADTPDQLLKGRIRELLAGWECAPQWWGILTLQIMEHYRMHHHPGYHFVRNCLLEEAAMRWVDFKEVIGG